jgi:hypothetical protein
MIPEALRARRAIGATFYSFFGGVWIAIWCFRALAQPVLPLVIVIVATAALQFFANSLYRRNAPALASEPITDKTRRQARWFNILNVGQWILILVVGNVLANIHLGAWVIPMAIVIIGLHFLPLAYLFENPILYATGSAFLIFAFTYPFVAAGGPSSNVGFLGAGLILWASSLWSLVVHSN